METAFWLDVLRVELDAIGEDDLIEPIGDVGANEHVVGLVPMELRKLFTRVEQIGAEVLRFSADARVAKNEKDRKLALEKSIELHNKAEALKAIFWI